METSALIFALFIGYTHAFEADHLVAVSTMVTKRNEIKASVRDGVYWGLGHTSTILAVAALFLLGKMAFSENVFRYLETGVGCMLVGLGVSRFYLEYTRQGHHFQVNTHNHHEAYWVGILHGLAGSGTLLLTVLSKAENVFSSFVYLLNFGLGSVGGMMTAAFLFSLPFSGKLRNLLRLQQALTYLSALVCIFLGIYIIYENLFARYE